MNVQLIERPQAVPEHRTALTLAWLAAVIGLPYAALNAYWAAGGTRLAARYGSHLVGRVGPVNTPIDTGFEAASAVLAGLMLVAIAAGVLATRIDADAPSRPAVRWIAWTAAGWLALYGGGLTLIGALVPLPGPLHQWHTLLWDPWYLVWGLALVAALARSSRDA